MNKIQRLLKASLQVVARVTVLLVAAAATNSCIIKYSFTGANIPAAAQTFSVAYFPNNALMVAPTLSNTLTEALRDRMMRQTRLGQVAENGDLAFEGEITSYTTVPTSISAEEVAARNRLTITVNVRFVSVLEPEWNFPAGGRQFSAYADYDATQMLSAVENALIEEIVEALVDNIFNASVANW